MPTNIKAIINTKLSLFSIYNQAESDQCFPVVDLSSKWTTKTELYNLFKRESKLCLPLKQDANQSFLRDVIMERKNYINVRRCQSHQSPIIQRSNC